MTAEEKRDRRKARHEAQKIVKKNLSVRFRLDATPAQMKNGIRTLTDIIIKQETNALPQ